ncbi:AsmA-like C-terminal region-containing protein [Paraflavisolibacter sp. H34]|uniref:AsmA family protein n=1 Tax=Huijunlia imazamoxiresistens TaxID=3127457 RepID=UPI00301619C8
MKKVAKILGIIVAVLLLLAFALPLLFKDKILQVVKTEINKNVEARVDFSDLSLSLFRHFPKVSLGLEDLSVVGVGEFRGDTLVSAKTLDATVGLTSLISGNNMKIHGVFLESPRIHALVNKDGKANWDIAKADTTPTAGSDTASAFALDLEKYAISDGYIFYNDESAGMKAEISGLDHEGKGAFTQDLFTLSTSTRAGGVTFTNANIPYLAGAATTIDADIEVNNKTSTYAFKKADLGINNLKLGANGFLQLVNDSTYNMDISFDAPTNDFKDILSLVPAIYKNDFDKLKTSGKAAFKGFVKGTYGPQAIPAYNVALDVKDGFFQYPDLPQPVKNIQIAAVVSNPDGVTDHTIVDVTKGHLEMGAEPFDFRFIFKNPETTRYIDAVVKGKLNLAEVSKFVKLEGNTKLAGSVWADLFVKGALSALQQQKGPFQAGGFLDIRNLYYSSKDFPQPIQNGTFKVDLQNTGGTADGTVVNVSSGHVQVGKDPVDFTLLLRNPVSTIDFSGKAKGRLTLDNVRQFVDLEPGTALSGLLDADLTFSGSKAAIDKKDYGSLNTAGSVRLQQTKYVSKEYPEGVTVQNALLQFTPKNVTLNSFAGRFKGTNLTASGVLDNLIGYALNNEALSGSMNLAADKVNLNEWMGTDTTTTATGSAPADPFLVPGNMNLSLQARAGAVQYDKVTYNNVKGTLQLKNETVYLQDVQTEALDGVITFNGSYSTKDNKKKPAVALSYNIKDVNVQKAFMAYNTVQKLMPVGQFLAGKLSSQLSLTGNLGGDMMPDLGTLTGNGNLFILQGVLSKFYPLEKLAATLNVQELQNISLKDIKSQFEFANGKVLMKPFDVKVKDITMQIGGTHGFDKSIDYIIGMKVPRRYMGEGGNALVNSLAAKANQKGIPVTVSDVIDFNVRMGGTLTNPVVKADLKQAAGDVGKELKDQAAVFVQQKVDSAKNRVKDSLVAVRNQVTNDLKNEVAKRVFGPKDSTTSTTGGAVEATKQKATETIKGALNGLLKKKKPATDSAK